MAENPIRKEDIIDIEGLREELKGIISDLLKLSELLRGEFKEGAAQYRKETEKINVATKEGRQQLKEKMKDITDSVKLYNALTKAVDTLNKNLKEVPQIGSYNDLNNKLKELRAQFKATADEGMRNNLIPRIKELDTQLKKLDASIGNNQRNVGNYKQAITDTAKQLLSFGGIAGIATVALNKLKEAFTSTTTGMYVINKVTEVSKQLFYDLATNFQINIKNLLDAAKIADMMTDIRQGDIIDMLKISKMEGELARLRFLSVDATKSEAEQLRYLNQYHELENRLMEYKINDKKEELSVIEAALKKRPQDTKLIQQHALVIAELLKIEEDRSLRVESRRTGIEEKERKAGEKRIESLAAGYQAEKEFQEKQEKDAIDRMEAEKKVADKMKELSGVDIETAQKTSDELVDIKLKQIEKTQEAELANAEFEKELSREVRDEKIANFVTEADKYLEVAASINTSFVDLLEKRKQKELSAVGDNAAKREAIEREYAKKEQALAISDAIIKGAQAIVRQFSDLPFYAALITSALTAATTATQISIISSQKFAEGGYTGDGTARDETGERVAGVVHEKEYVIPKEPTRKYRALLEAIHEDNPMAIAEELRNRQFHTVWGGVQPQLIQAQKQDPYTKMMYELLKNSVTTYTDSNGDTVLRFADGSTRVIKK